MLKPDIANVRIIDSLTAEAQNYIDTLSIVVTESLKNIYNNPTIEQREHWLRCLNQCECEHGNYFGICSYNKSSFIVIWKTDSGIRWVFPFDSVLVTNRVIEQWYDYMDAIKQID